MQNIELLLPVSTIILNIVLIILVSTKKKISSISQKDTISIIDGMLKLNDDINDYENKKLLAQNREKNKTQDYIIYRYLNIFCEKMNVNNKDSRYICFKELIADEIWKVSETEISNLIKMNHISEKTEAEWEAYKNDRMRDIWLKSQDAANNNWDENLIGFPHSQTLATVTPAISEVVKKEINNSLNEMRRIAIKYDEKIEKNRNQINELKEILTSRVQKFQINNDINLKLN